MGAKGLKEPSKRQIALFEAAQDIEDNPTADAGTLGFGPKFLAACCLPYVQLEGKHLTEKGGWSRTNGTHTLVIDPDDRGEAYDPQANHDDVRERWAKLHPYGRYPRLILLYCATEAKINRTDVIDAGKSFRDFCRRIGVEWGSDAKEAVAKQFELLAHVDFNLYRGPDFATFRLTDSFRLGPHESEERLAGMPARQQYIKLTNNCVQEFQQNLVPIDWRAVKALQHKPMALDIMLFLNYRLYSIRRETMIPWRELMAHFGTTQKGPAAHRPFGQKFRDALEMVKTLYPNINVYPSEGGLILNESPLMVAKKDRGLL